MNKQRQTRGFTIVEMLIALMIMGILLAAMAVAFDASAKNYTANEGISKTMNTARAALLRITTELRTATAVAVIGTGGDPDNQQCSLLNSQGQNITYQFKPDEGILYLVTNDDLTDSDYVLCRNVTSATFNRATVPSDPAAIRNVRIVLAVTDENGKISQTLAAAAVVRKNL